MLPVYKLGVLGDGGVGKTALISQFRSKTFTEEFDPTIEDSYTVDTVISGQKCKLEILDTAGADEYKDLRDGWIRSNEGFILVYSISSKSSFTRIQGLYDEIKQVKKSPHQVPIILVGNKVDMAERDVSLLEGREMARMLGCGFVEASAKDGGNVERSFDNIVMQLQKTCKEKALDDLIDSLPQWHNLVGNLEGKISLSQVELSKANTSALAPVHAINATTEQPDPKKLPTLQRFRVKLSALHLPRLLRHYRSFPGINNCRPPSRPQSLLVLPKRKVSSVNCDISQPSQLSEHPSRSMIDGNYNHEVQMAFSDITMFLSTIGREIGRVRKQARVEEIMARATIDIEVRDNEGMPTVEKGDKTDIAQVEKALDQCQELCENAAFEVIQHGESIGKIQEMENEFARAIEIATKLRIKCIDNLS